MFSINLVPSMLLLVHFYYRGEQYVIDWKTSKRRKSSLSQTFDNPLQLVAYLGAYNIQPSTSLKVCEVACLLRYTA